MPENPLAALGPIAWDSLDGSDLDSFLGETFGCAQIIADSVPTVASTPATTTSAGRPRSQTDGAVSYNPGKIWGWGGAATPTTTTTAATAADDGLPGAREKKAMELRQSWKEVKAGGANPNDVAVYKMNGGREGYAGSSWFARRSLHKNLHKASNLDFDTFKRGLLHEFDLGVPRDEKTKPVRTMVTKKRVEHVPTVTTGDLDMELQIFLLEADFPGPTASRDFVTMLLTAESTVPGISGIAGPCKQFMMVSKPCQHPETPARSGFVRAQYESVELIRQVPIPKAEAQELASTAGRRTRSSIDLRGNDEEEEEKGDQNDKNDHEMAIEWIMITRNNPGGNVPRFLVDKSTPSSIVSDANKFLDWLVAKEWVDDTGVQVQDVQGKGETAAKAVQAAKQRSSAPDTATSLGGLGAVIHEEEEEAKTKKEAAESYTTGDTPSMRGGAASSTRLFNMFAGALGGASTAVVSKLPNPFEGAVQVIYPESGVASVRDDDRTRDESDTDDDLDVSDVSDVSDVLDVSDEDGTDGDSYSDIEQSEQSEEAGAGAVRSRASTLAVSEGEHGVSAGVATAAAAAAAGAAVLSTGSESADKSIKEPDDSKSTSSKTHSVASNPNSNSNSKPAKTKEDKEKQKAEKKERDAERNAQKLLEKHNRAVARREAQFQKELQKLEQKRRQQADKEAARLQKCLEGNKESTDSKDGKEKDAKEATTKKIAGLLEYTQRELERAAVQIEALREEVRELQAENRRLKQAD